MLWGGGRGKVPSLGKATGVFRVATECGYGPTKGNNYPVVMVGWRVVVRKIRKEKSFFSSLYYLFFIILHRKTARGNFRRGASPLVSAENIPINLNQVMLA